ncbi:MAG: hypothetical protein ACI4SF_08290, partial [Oscillospiraceae bacterium]
LQEKQTPSARLGQDSTLCSFFVGSFGQAVADDEYSNLALDMDPDNSSNKNHKYHIGFCLQ